MLRLSLPLLVACTAPTEAPDPSEPTLESPSGVTFAELAFFQAVKVAVLADGAAIQPEDRNAPLIAGRPGVLRARIALPDEGEAMDLELVVDVHHQGATDSFRATGVLSPDAVDITAHDLVVELPAEAWQPDATYTVHLSSPEGQVAVFPDSGEAPLAVMETGPLKVRFVPFEVQGFTPDTSEAVIEGLRMALFATWPVTEVEVSLAPVQRWDGPADLGDINVQVGVLQEDAMIAGEVSWDTYYFGLVTGVATRDEYEGITGTSEDGGGGELVRAYFAAGAAFGDQRAEDTLIHEMGHVHGLEHTACEGEDNPDPNYPHPDATIGVEGWDLRTHTLVPADTKDMMSYCYPRWISDYGYRKIAAHVANAQGYAGYQ